MPLNVPNLLTWLRILLIPLFVGDLLLPERWLGPQRRTSPRPSSSSSRR